MVFLQKEKLRPENLNGILKDSWNDWQYINITESIAHDFFQICSEFWYVFYKRRIYSVWVLVDIGNISKDLFFFSLIVTKCSLCYTVEAVSIATDVSKML